MPALRLRRVARAADSISQDTTIGGSRASSATTRSSVGKVGCSAAAAAQLSGGPACRMPGVSCRVVRISCERILIQQAYGTLPPSELFTRFSMHRVLDPGRRQDRRPDLWSAGRIRRLRGQAGRRRRRRGRVGRARRTARREPAGPRARRQRSEGARAALRDIHAARRDLVPALLLQSRSWPRSRARACHYFDLTEDVEVTRAVRRTAEARRRPSCPQCGLAPGFISIAANELITHFDELRTIKLRVGALPQHPNNVLKYSLTWSTEGLINEYGNPCQSRRRRPDGRGRAARGARGDRDRRHAVRGVQHLGRPRLARRDATASAASR